MAIVLKTMPIPDIRQSKSKAKLRDKFTDSELQAIFDLPVHKKPKYRPPSKYWVPLLGLFTGARINEICQLYLDDIYQIDDIWVFRIDEIFENQRVKNKSSKRIVPIHKQLIDMGFLLYVERCRTRGDKRLFEDLEFKRDGYAQVVSKWFGNYKEKAGLPKDGTKAFHSFRHTFVDNLKQQQIEEPLVAALVGHNHDTMTFGLYGKGYDVKAVKADGGSG